MHPRPASAFRMVMIMATAAGTVGLGLAGCRSSTQAGSGGGASTSPSATSQSSQSSRQAVRLAARQAARINSCRFTLSLQLSGPVTGSMSGSVQMRSRPSPLAEVEFGSVDFSGITVPGSVQEITTSNTLYLKIALLQVMLGKPWVAIALSGLQQGTGISLGQFLQQAQANNPMVYGQMLAASKNLRSVGTQTIDGVTTTHYTGTFSADAGLARLPSNLRTIERTWVHLFGDRSIGFDAWIDAQHRIRKLVVTQHRGSLRLSATMQVTSFNQPVNISVPPASQVKTISPSDLHI
jgi:LppX_LprAFG lipoprotein